METLKRGKFAQDAARLDIIISEQGVGGLVVGLPLNMDGSDGPSAQSARAFGRNWAGHSPLPLAFQDERRFEHTGQEFLFVLSGSVEVEFAGKLIRLDAGDAVYFDSNIPHRSRSLDGKIAEAHVQLGDLYAGQHEYNKSIPEYVRAIELNPNLSDAHYRLGTDYVHVGQKDQAQKEFAVYQKLRAEHLAEVDKERAEVQQFVYSEKSDAPTKP